MTTVLLIAPNISHVARTDFPPLGLADLAAYLRTKIKDIKIKIIDFGVEDFSKNRFLDKLKKEIPEIVGLSLSTLHFPQAKKITKIIKKTLPKTKVIWGGPHVDVEYVSCLDYCDFVVIGEGEVSFYELVKKVLDDANVEDIKGIAYKKYGKVKKTPLRERIEDLDKHPWPAYDLLDLKRYFEYPMIGMLGGRGCPFNCTFCDSPLRWHRKVKNRSVKNIVDEIEFLNKSYGIKGIFFFDDLINLPQERALNLCEEIIKRGLNKKVYFQAQLRANKALVSERLFEMLKKANFNKISFGVESGSQKVLDSMNKNVTVKELENAVKLGLKSGIDTRAFFMIGNWDESLLDILKTIKFILKTGVNPSLCIATPLPGTEFYNRMKTKGYLENLDWSKATTKIAVSRTNKLSKFSINLVYKLLYYFFFLKKGFDLPMQRKVDFFKKKMIKFFRKN